MERSIEPEFRALQPQHDEHQIGKNVSFEKESVAEPEIGPISEVNIIPSTTTYTCRRCIHQTGSAICSTTAESIS
jgi:hypothetical protein